MVSARWVGQAGLVGLVLAAGLPGCGNRGVEEADGPGAGVSPLFKVASGSGTLSQAVIEVRLARDGAPLPGVRVAFSRSISGRAPDYAWAATTDDAGQARVGITSDRSPAARSGVNGLYLARAVDAATGVLVGEWGSIPIRGGLRQEFLLEPGRRVRSLSRSGLETRAEYVAQAEDFASFRNWLAVDYTIGTTNPASASAHMSDSDAYSRRVYRNAETALTAQGYAVGSILVKETFTFEDGQKALAEAGGVLAMVKRGGAFNPRGAGWEWFMLSEDGSTVLARGGEELMEGGCNACHTAADVQEGGADLVFPHPAEYVAGEADFTAYRQWAKIDERSDPNPLLGGFAHGPDAIRRVYKRQLLANPDRPSQGYPTGTVILKEVEAGGEVVKITAMVKRGGGYNDAGGGWEWFMLEPGTGAIAGRGGNLMDGMCSSCHSSALDPAIGKDYVFKHKDDPFNRM